MPKRLSSTAHSTDINQAAFQMVHRLTGTNETPIRAHKVTSSDISRVMAAMGRRGGRIGGKRRLTTMTPEQRHEAAQKAAQARWAKPDDNGKDGASSTIPQKEHLQRLCLNSPNP
jgi:hypothetical protein